jgi:putative membrane protein
VGILKIDGEGGCMYYYDGMGFGGWWWAMMLFMALFWIAVIVGIVWLIVYLTRRPATGPGGPGAETALDILNKRYAKGEISSEEYERVKREIGG